MERMSAVAPGLQAALHPHAGIAGPARPPDRVPADRRRARRAQGARPGPDASGAVGAAVVLQDRAVPAVARFRRAGRPVPVEGTGALLPGAAAGEVRQGDGAAPPEARDHRHRGDQLDGQPHGRDLPAAHAGRHRPQRRRKSPRPSPSPARRWTRASCGRRSTRSTARSPKSVQIDALQVIWTLQRQFTRWLLSRPGAIPDIATAVERYHDGFRDIRAGERHPAGFAAPRVRGQPAATGSAKGLPPALAGQLAALPYLEPCLRHHRGGARAQAASRSTSPRSTSASATRCTCRGCWSRSRRCRSKAAGTRRRAACCATSWRAAARAGRAGAGDAGQRTPDAKVSALARPRRRRAALHPVDARRPGRAEDAGLPDRFGRGAAPGAAGRRAADAYRRRRPMAAGVSAGGLSLAA